MIKKSFDECLNSIGEIGHVEATSLPLVRVKGLPGVKLEEIVVFENGELGRVTTIDGEDVNVILYSKNIISQGVKVARTGDRLKLPINDDVLGKVIDPFGRSLYANTEVSDKGKGRYVNVPALNIAYRKKIKEPFLTGVSAVDMILPIGKGQRELLIGDRKTGKTAFALQVMLTQSANDVITVYCCVGKRRSDIKVVEEYLKDNDIQGNTVIVATTPHDSPGLIHLAPYTAMSIAEYFRDQGRDVLLVFDDLTNHAKFHREISLVENKFPGRDSYPGDVFYIHSKLLERAGSFNEGTITCLPIVNTVEGDISGYIQTNLMSMTDGHLFFDKEYYYSGRRPAINNFVSVTRVGRQTQTPLRWAVNRELNSFFALYNRTKNFVHFGAELNEGIKSTLKLGDRIILFFNQTPDVIYELNLQIAVFCAIWSGTWNTKDDKEFLSTIKAARDKYHKDEKLRQIVDQLITEAADFNDLLGKFMKQVIGQGRFV